MDEKISISSKKNKAGTSVNLDGEFTIYSVSHAQKILFENFETWVSPVALDLSKLQEIDTAGVQLLLFLKRQLNDANKKVYIKKSSEQVDAVLSLLDLTNHFTAEA